MRATLTDIAEIQRHGYHVEPYGDGWLLTHDDGSGFGPSQLMVGDHGGVSPTQWEAVAEAQHRIKLDEPKG